MVHAYSQGCKFLVPRKSLMRLRHELVDATALVRCPSPFLCEKETWFLDGFSHLFEVTNEETPTLYMTHADRDGQNLQLKTVPACRLVVEHTRRTYIPAATGRAGLSLPAPARCALVFDSARLGRSGHSRLQLSCRDLGCCSSIFFVNPTKITKSFEPSAEKCSKF